MFRLNPSDIKRQLKRLGIKNVEVDTPAVEEIIVRLEDGREIVAYTPQVMIVRVPGGAAMIQVVAETLEEREAQAGGQPEISEEDVKLVAEQAGVSMEEARQALEEASGDIAAAILLIEERKQAS